ncbi:type I restriction enzyme S subunit [Peptoniphilus koenoeneniae]|uniref:Type I restriction enzyme S subunit n=1 Tax=Peptoniphilus koenoeneniae TaxID=507751 RepID=A0ABU0AY37_9FIRM|nr:MULTISPECIES: restriction endonuclease subunit S [Peptoniphilus]ERT57245.1 type I restriction modification DNA specificity domain protein [Peptoniphilus sp. BV3C26]MDQ0274895.1 type I restriction enzyme S subunit [Peptoniphilus koenoeneniae]
MTRKMKDSGIEWIGEIPEEWEVTKLKQLASFHNGDRGKNYPSGNDLVDEGVYFLTSNNIHGYYLDIDKSISKFITNERLNVLNGAKIQINDIVFCLRGSVGNCSINKSLEKGTIASSLMLIRPINIDADFLNYIMQSDIKVMEVLNLTTGSCAANLSAINVSNFKILQPSLSEQVKISNYLNKKTEQIENIKSTIVKEIQTLEDYKKSLITEAVTKGLDKNVKMKDSGIEWIGEIPKHWEIFKVKYLATILNGSTPNTGKINYWDGDIKWITPKDLFDNKIITDSLKKITKEGYHSCGTNMVPINTILLSTRAPIGTVAIAKTELCTNQGIKSIVCNREKLNYKLLFYYLLTKNEVLNFLGNGTTFMELSTSSLMGLPIPCASINEQNKIVDYLDKKTKSIDEAITAKQKQLEVLEEYKKSLIYEYVTGKKEVL